MRSKPFKPRPAKEDKTQDNFLTYLKLQYPHVEYRVDAAAGMRMSIGQAMKNKRMQKRRAWPDLFIAEPRNGFAGLFIEMKREGERIMKRNGEFVDDHVAEQAEVLSILRAKGYAAQFVVGFHEAKRIMDEYMR